jgi:hypothetical protein
MGEMGDGSGPRTCRNLKCLTPLLVRIGIPFSHYIVAVVCLIRALLCETDNSEEGTEVFDKNPWTVKDNF